MKSIHNLSSNLQSRRSKVEIVLCHVHLRNQKFSTIYHLTEKGIDETFIPRMTFSRTFNYLWNNYAPFNGFMYSGHSNGQEMRFVTKKTSHRVATLPELKRKFEKHNARLDVICFDSCFMSNVEVMNSISPYCKYILTSPGFHPNFSYLLTKSFYSFSSHKIHTYLASIQREFMKLYENAHAKYVCAVLFASKKAKQFYKYMDHLEETDQLHFSKRAFESGELLTHILDDSDLPKKKKIKE